jgi:hypothetical protein
VASRMMVCSDENRLNAMAVIRLQWQQEQLGDSFKVASCGRFFDGLEH